MTSILNETEKHFYIRYVTDSVITRITALKDKMCKTVNPTTPMQKKEHGTLQDIVQRFAAHREAEGEMAIPSDTLITMQTLMQKVEELRQEKDRPEHEKGLLKDIQSNTGRRHRHEIDLETEPAQISDIDSLELEEVVKVKQEEKNEDKYEEIIEDELEELSF